MLFKQIIQKAVFLIFCIGIACAIGEFAAVVFVEKNSFKNVRQKLAYLQTTNRLHLQYPNHISAHDQEIGWHYLPNTHEDLITSEFTVRYDINSLGFRDAETQYFKTSSVFRVLALGDSFTFGEGVAYGRRYTEIIERALDNIEVINMGIQGYGLDQSMLLLEKRGFTFSPDLVLIFVNRPMLERCSLFFCSAYKPRFNLNEQGKNLILE